MIHDNPHQTNAHNDPSEAANVPIINHCQNTYKPDPEYILTRTLGKIPEKFLVGLQEVRLFDTRPNTRLRKSSVCKAVSAHHSVIEIYMDDAALSGSPFFSRMLLNMVFLFAFNEHITHDLQPRSTDEEILSYPASRSRINLRWGYFGVWTPVLSLFNVLQYLIWRVPLLYKGWLAITNRFIAKHGSSRHDEDVTD
jgi:hypothetical protein